MIRKMADRRKHPRASKPVPLSLKGAEPRILNKVDNISSSGVLCHTAKKLPIMSKVAMEITVDASDESYGQPERIECQGVVVRSEPHPDDTNGGYGTAIFFTRLSDEDRARLERFVDQYIVCSASSV